MPPNHLIICCPLLLLPSIFPSIRVFSNESVLCIRWPKDWSFSFSVSPSNEYSELISFRMNWLDLLAVQGTLKSLLQHHSSKASILRCSAFFMVQVSHPHRTTGKTTALTAAAAAKPFQSCPTPCDPIDCSQPAPQSLGFSRHELERVPVSFSIALTRWTFVGKVMSLLFNMLSRLVIAFLPGSKSLFNFMAAVTICSDFGAQGNSLLLFPPFPHLFAMK